MPKHIRDKCIENGISPLQGMKEALFTIKKAIEIGSIWKNERPIKLIKYKIIVAKKLKLTSNLTLKNY